MRSGYFAVISCKGAKAMDLECTEAVKGGLEVVEDDTIGKTLEDER